MAASGSARRPVDGPQSPPRIAVVVASHNRIGKTLAALSSLEGQHGQPEEFALHVVLVDDGSTDGTSEAVKRDYPAVEVIAGDGSLYWSGAMHVAQSTAEAADPDAILWLNDDVALADDAIRRAVAVAAEFSWSRIVVGGTVSSTTGAFTYAGARRAGRRPGNLVPVWPENEPITVDTFNGNFVLIPRIVYRHVGRVDPSFIHAYGDIDYGLRATELGFVSMLLPGPVGTCERNPPETSWRHAASGRLARTRLLFSRKGYPPRAHYRFNVKHAGPMGVAYATLSYLRAMGLILVGR